MAGISIGSSFQLTSPQPHLANASFPDAPTRLAQGQLRHVSWRYSQDNPDAHYRIKPLAICFLADGITPAVQFDSWGTLEAHWRIAPVTSDDLPESATPSNKYYTSARAALKADLVNGLVPAAQLPPYPAATAPVQATNTSLGTVRGGLTGNVNINADGSMTATSAAAAATFASITGAPTDNTNLSTALNLKVDKVAGLALSSNDYTIGEKAKLAALAVVAFTASYTDLINKPVPVINTAVTPVYSVTAFYAYLDTIQYTTPTGYPGGIRFFRWNNPLDTVGATRISPLTATNVVQASWAEVSNSGVLYASLGSATDGSVNQAVITSALARLATIASPTFTGIASAVTAVVGTTTTQLATTEFVQAALPIGLIEVITAGTGKRRYYTDFLAYFNGGFTGQNDVVRFGPGVFDNRAYGRMIPSNSLSIILSPQTSWLFTELAPYPGIYATDTSKGLFTMDGSGTGKITGNILWYTDSYSATEVREIQLSNLYHTGRILHQALVSSVDLPIKLRLTNVNATCTGQVSYPNIGTWGSYILSAAYIRNSWRSLDLEINNCRFYVENGAVIDSCGLQDTAPYTFPAYPITRAIIRNSVAYLAEAFAGVLSTGQMPASMISIDSQNMRVKTVLTTTIVNTGSASGRKVFSKGTNSVSAALVASVYTLIPFDTIVNNIGGGLVGTAFTAPATDVYAVVVSLRFADGSTPTPVKNVFIGLSSGGATSITDGRWRDTMSNRSTVDCYLEVMLTAGQTYSAVYFLDGFASSALPLVSFRALNVI